MKKKKNRGKGRNIKREDIVQRRIWRYEERYLEEDEVKMQKEWVHKWRSNQKPERLKICMRHFD